MFDTQVRDDFLRIRQSRSGWVWPEVDLMGGGVPAFVGRVTSPASKIGVGDYLLVRPSFVMGTESEGASGIFSDVGASTIPVYLVGPALPVTGDYLVCKFVDNRWVAERGSVPSGGGTIVLGSIPNCFCSPIPTTLTMTSADPSCNYRMFQSCTIAYGPTPAVFSPLTLPENTFLSTQSFPDPSINNALFYYYLTCQYNQYVLTRLYPDCIYGSPFRDGILYTWSMGGYGNTCQPFHLDDGSAYSGSDATCFVTIDS